jgi:hypothetical protein
MAIFRTGTAVSEEWTTFIEPMGTGEYSDFQAEITADINQEIQTGTYRESEWVGVVPLQYLPSNNPAMYPALAASKPWSGGEWGQFFSGFGDFIGKATKGTADILGVGKKTDIPPGTAVTPWQPTSKFPWGVAILAAGGLGVLMYATREPPKSRRGKK